MNVSEVTAMIEKAKLMVETPEARRIDRAVDMLKAHLAQPKAKLVTMMFVGDATQYKVCSQTTDDKCYSVYRFADNTWTCNCDDYLYRRNSKSNCKHIYLARLLRKLMN